MPEITLHRLQMQDIPVLDAAFVAQQWPRRTATLQRYLAEQARGQRMVWVAQVGPAVAGYITRVPVAAHGPFAGQLPEIADFNVFGPYRRAGVGTALMAAAEADAGPRISLGVGPNANYGPAQRLYVRRGYVPDGSGVWYQDHPLAAGAVCRNDDALVLYLSKSIN